MTLHNIKKFGFLPTILFAATAQAAGVSFSGNSEKILEYPVDKSTGLDMLFVAASCNGLSIEYESSSPQNVKWYKYSNLGGGYAEEITSAVAESGMSVLHDVEGDLGYIIEDGDVKYYFWLTDYSKHIFSIQSVNPASQQECTETTLDINANAAAIHYYSINGRQNTLSRDIDVIYYNLEWDNDALQYVQKKENIKAASLESQYIIMPAVTCETSFEISGDRFLKEWNREVKVTSNPFTPIAVECQTTAEQISEIPDDDDSNSNQISTGNSDALGGSAPSEISFKSYVTDGVIHYEWQMAADEDFEYITHRITEPDLDYTFTEEGTVYVRFIGSNSDGSCETFGDTYMVNIGASELRIPNAFSPDGDGVNDIWKVGYRSLLKFQCWIFDRYGNEIYHFDNPAGGWDGRRKGKIVPSGVYYYVIQAEGADGRKYKKGGDINILLKKKSGDTTTQQ